MSDEQQRPIVLLEQPDARRLSVPETIIRDLAHEFIRVRDYAPASQVKVLSWIHEWWKAGMPGGSEYRDSMIARGMSRSSISSIFGVLRLFGEFLVERRIVAYNPFRNIVVRNSWGTLSRQAFSHEQVKQILEYLSSSSEVGMLRDRAIVCLMLGTGLRCQAVSAANLGDYNPLHQPAVLIVRHKGHWAKDSFVYIYNHLKNIIEDWLNVRKGVRGDGAPIFTTLFPPYTRLSIRSVRWIVKRVLRDSGVGGTPHQLRHTAITIAREQGAPLDAVREMAGHRSVITTEAYDHSIQRRLFAPEQVLDRMFEYASTTQESTTQQPADSGPRPGSPGNPGGG